MPARGSLSQAKSDLGSFHDYSSYGWVIGGGSVVPTTSRPALSRIERVTFASDTITASTRGNLTTARENLNKGSSNFTYGWIAGGYNFSLSAGYTSTERVTFASDTVTASTRALINNRGSGVGNSVAAF
jgi:hypothetical protein